MNQPLLEIKQIVKQYDSTRALDGVSLAIFPGEIIGLLGVNGAGKTTLSSIIATLHPATSGEILFNGRSIYTDLMAYRKAIGFCPQTQNLDMFLTVRENLEFAGRYHLIPTQELKNRVDELIAELDLKKYEHFKIDALSGGNKQRVLIARALVHHPKIVILDEPTVGLDPDIRRTLWAQIKALKTKGISVILTTHYLDEAEELTDRICMLHKGRVKLTERTSHLREQHQQARLEDIFIKLSQDANREE